MCAACQCRLSNHAAALPTPSPTHSRDRPQTASPSPGEAFETDLPLAVPAVAELVPTPQVDAVQEPRKTSPVVATLAPSAEMSQKSETEPRSHRSSATRPKSKKRPSLAELDPMLPTLSQADSNSSVQPANHKSADAAPEDAASSHPAAVPTLNLNSITEERNKRNATTNKRSYVLEQEASGVGTTVEIDAISPVPGLPHTVSHVNRGDSVREPTPQMPVDASEMLGMSGLEESIAFAPHGALHEAVSSHIPLPAAESSHPQQNSDSNLDVPVSAYEEAADTRGMTAIMGDQTAMMKNGGARQLREVPLAGVQEGDGSVADTARLPMAASDSLPPGAIVRGRDEFLDQLKSKPGEVSASVAPSRVIHQDTTGIFASPWDNSDDVPRGGSRAATYVPSDTASVMSGGSGMSTWTLSSHAPQRSVRRSAFSTMPSSSRSGRWSSRASHITPSSSGHSNWTLSGEKSNWTVSGGDKSTFTAGGDQSNWTLSGNTSHFSVASRRIATRPPDDGRSEAFTMGFTEGASEWGLSPRGTVKDDLDVGHSESAISSSLPTLANCHLCIACKLGRRSPHVDLAARTGWLQNDEIVVPSRLAATDDQSRYTGLRQKYEQRKLRQQYAADDTTVPETALRRVDEYDSHGSSCAWGCWSTYEHQGRDYILAYACTEISRFG